MERSETLVRLQEADLVEVRTRKRLDELPEKRAILDARKKRREVEQLRGRAEEFLGGLRSELSRLEDEASGVEAKIGSEQARVMSGEVVNPKEVQNITREMDALKRRKDKLEIEELRVMEKVEKAEGQLARIDGALTALDAREGELTQAFTSKGGELQNDIDRAHREREALAAALDPETLDAYEEARASKGGIGVGVLEGDTCSACRVQLPAEKLHSLRSGEDVARCPNCRRLLVVRRGGSSA
ncbi:MAG: hypothetical protein IBX62_01515 [Coriobacteriia bacterium]|nr:hypothetical protein [Coriobacteriia bacterium]